MPLALVLDVLEQGGQSAQLVLAETLPPLDEEKSDATMRTVTQMAAILHAEMCKRAIIQPNVHVVVFVRIGNACRHVSWAPIAAEPLAIPIEDLTAAMNKSLMEPRPSIFVAEFRGAAGGQLGVAFEVVGPERAPAFLAKIAGAGVQ